MLIVHASSGEFVTGLVLVYLVVDQMRMRGIG